MYIQAELLLRIYLSMLYEFMHYIHTYIILLEIINKLSIKIMNL